jgi:hypothetical protein
MNVGYAPGYPAMIIIYDDARNAYVRWGFSPIPKPNPQRELVTVDKDGNIDKETVLLLDYNDVTRVDVYRIDDKPITVEGGRFITIANNAPPAYTYYDRGIEICRSNVTLKNLTHEVVGEGEHGAPYFGFIFPTCANNLLCEGLVLSSHRSYCDFKPDGSVRSVMGTYDIGGSFATNVTFRNCIQSNFFKDEERMIAYEERERWGIMGTNYCKNLTYEGCTLSRLDAHAGVYNVTVKDTTITYIKLTGGGVAQIEGCRVIAPEGINYPLFELRVDYGSTWSGEVSVKDTVFYNKSPDEPVRIASAIWNNWGFGYKTHLPSVTLDNVRINAPSEKIYCFSSIVREPGQKIDMPVLDNGEINLNPMDIGATVTVKNCPEYEFVGSSDEYVSGKITVKKENK